MSSLLARRFKIDVSTDATNWLPLRGVQDFAPVENPTIQSTADYDNDGFDTVEKTLTAWTNTAKIRRDKTAGVVDPGQELVRKAGMYKFDDAARVYTRWYDRNGLDEAYQGQALVAWAASKTGAADIEEVTITFRGDGVVVEIENPATSAAVPAIASVTPGGAGTGAMVRITGAYFTGVTASQVKFGATAATAIDVVSDSVIEAIVPAGAAGSVNITVTNTAGVSANFAYTRGA